MAFIPGFEHDVFISYAHANNVRLTKEDAGFVTKLYEDLMLFLTAELGRREYFSIWLDKEELRGNDDFDTVLNASFLKSAVLVCICSQSYVESAWCRRELVTFSNHKHPLFDLKVGDAGSYRIFRIDLGEVVERHAEVPPFFFERMLGHKFYEEIEGGVDVPFRRSDPAGEEQRYWNAVRRLAHEIAELLRQMKKRAQPAEKGAAVSVAAPAKTIFLAETADDLEDQRAGVKSALEQQSKAKAALTGIGLRVLPEFPLSLGDPGLIDKLREALRSADMSVHLIGPLPGKTPVNETRPLVQLQWEVAGEVAREKALPRVAWLCDGLDSAKVKEHHRAFLQSLEEEASGSPPEVLRVGVEELRELLVGRLFPPPLPKGTEAEQQEEAEEIDRLVYLTYLPEDRDGAVQLKEALRRERLDVKLFRYEDRDPQMLARIHNASLQRSDGVAIFYGTDALWLDRLVEEARDTLKARARKNPLKAVCIGDGPPDPKDSPVDVDYDRFVVADCRHGVRPKDLQRFVELIKS
jgi:hypothetical protein